MRVQASALAASDASVSAASWHVNGWVDVLGYAFSWVFVLLPMALAGDAYRVDFPAIFLVVVGVTEAHRHFTYPYVYLDSQVFARHRLRFTLFPAVMMLLWVGSVLMERRGGDWPVLPVAGVLSALALTLWAVQQDRPDGGAHAPSIRRLLAGAALAFSAAFTVELLWQPSRLRIQGVALLNAFAVVAALWNVWHVYMQKYGILRMYNAKSAGALRVPGWVDRLLVVAWLPLYLFQLGPKWFGFALSSFSRGAQLLGPVFDGFARCAPILWGPSAALVAFALGAWLQWEWRSSRLRHMPRMWMFLGTTLLSASFLFVHPLKAYLAYAFSHAVDYMIFVWAFQRRRYQRGHAHRPILGRLIKHPVVLYALPLFGIALATSYFKYYGRWLFPGGTLPVLLTIPTYIWFKYYTVYQSMIHFYYDGFLWKMRLPEVVREL